MGICIQPSANQYLCLGKKSKIIVIENDGKIREITKTKEKKKTSKPRRMFEGYSCQLLAFMLGAPGSERRVGGWDQSQEKQVYSSPVHSCA